MCYCDLLALVILYRQRKLYLVTFLFFKVVTIISTKKVDTVSMGDKEKLKIYKRGMAGMMRKKSENGRKDILKCRNEEERENIWRNELRSMEKRIKKRKMV